MTTSMLRLAALTVAVACLSNAGCSLLAPRADPSRYFTLAASPAAQPSAGDTARRLTYGLGPITLPAYLDRNAVATRVSPTEIKYSLVDRWAEPLQASVTRVLLENMTARLGTDHVLVYPWSGGTPIDYQIEVEVLHLERTASGENRLAARWRIKDGRTGREAVASSSNIQRPGPPGDPGGSAAALSAGLGELSEEIAAALQTLPPPQATPAPTRKAR